MDATLEWINFLRLFSIPSYPFHHPPNMSSKYPTALKGDQEHKLTFRRTERMTLAEQLAQIEQPTPQGLSPLLPSLLGCLKGAHQYIETTSVIDFDPEDAYTTYNAEKSEDQKDLDAARQDYVDVG